MKYAMLVIYFIAPWSGKTISWTCVDGYPSKDACQMDAARQISVVNKRWPQFQNESECRNTYDHRVTSPQACAAHFDSGTYAKQWWYLRVINYDNKNEEYSEECKPGFESGDQCWLACSVIKAQTRLKTPGLSPVCFCSSTTNYEGRCH